LEQSADVLVQALGGWFGWVRSSLAAAS
jgi:hypothetical protein